MLIYAEALHTSWCTKGLIGFIVTRGWSRLIQDEAVHKRKANTQLLHLSSLSFVYVSDFFLSGLMNYVCYWTLDSLEELIRVSDFSHLLTLETMSVLAVLKDFFFKTNQMNEWTVDLCRKCWLSPSCSALIDEVKREKRKYEFMHLQTDWISYRIKEGG